MDFKDLFSLQASDYARYRPTYPNQLFTYLNSLTPKRDLVWDVGTGNGQAAVELARSFKQVIATDPSAKQLAEATRLPNIDYRNEAAESPSLDSGSANLITVAQAFHWFKHDQFAQACKRVAAPGCHLVVWSYALANITPELYQSVEHLYNGILGSYWEKERKHVEEGYAQIPMPFTEVKTPSITIEADWTLEQWVGYLKTWSAMQKYLKTEDPGPVAQALEDIRQSWGSAPTRKVVWPLNVRVWKIA